MIFSKLAALAVSAVFVVAQDGHVHLPLPLNNEDGVAPYEYVPPPLPASSVPLTNSERLARGLPVLPPRLRRHRFTDNAADFGRQGLPSNVPRGLPSALPGLGRRGVPSALPGLGRRGLPSAIPGLGFGRRGLPSAIPGLGRRGLPSAIPGLAGRGLPSLLPRQELPVIYDGIIRVEYAQNRSTAGYIANRLNRLREYTLTQDPISAANITIHADRLSDDPFSIVVENSANPDLPFLGAVVGPYSSSAKLGHGSKNHAFLVGSDETQPNAPPSAGRTTAYGGSARESGIWQIDQLSLEITAHWVNPNGKKPRTSILAVDNYFVLSGDQAALDDAFKVKSAEVVFLLEATD